jgi:hypothetical protein
MLKDIQTTLYDIFGYLLPGFIVLIGIVILFWSIFLPETVLYIPQFTAELWIAVTIVAYIFGHICQAIANLILHRSDASERILRKNSANALPSPPIDKESQKNRSAASARILSKRSEALPTPLIDTIIQKISTFTGIKPEDLEQKPHFLYQVCDEIIVQYGKTGDRDIYIFREGFYRGSCVAFVILTLALIVRVLRPNTMLNVDGTVYQISIAMLIFLILVAFIGAGLNFSRYKRFGDYRVTQAALGFLALHAKPKDEHKPVI